MAVDPFEGIDMSDPCAVWPVMQKAKYMIMMGRSVSRAAFGEDDTSFGKSDLPMLEREISRLKGECQTRKTGRRSRHAITAGFRGGRW